ncbi:PLP-dependent aminotransferase family protein [Brucella intermedia]|uniref:PLP-dependent aminotransferase family protein n=1 Tax=Brucella intermedia GD04153 TaxID=2975438 RepID=A0AA42KJ15_9HYPH|nr:PLP-dependent aminotransferase family protein [Brucella intermedia]ERI16261.1 GntR family transcriptional regulator [Ochrobactrum sp. EGD-AQ16]KAB2697366.1 PLP-dependent aminotransferase family protein [Brucella intermedia]MDH0123188.1 PLP-dependent aminotransferase family protein [Brucella intermedia GD04153]MPR61144.1 PLP-dependent aminotransferase family protein [Brucella intermedia]NVM42990.1 PLP-dependent aminotransferase family protein [Brucella intermedia]
MTNWIPDLSGKSGPFYLQLADAIEEAIGNGGLPAGAKLPPQRNLAFDLKVTIGTIGRAYALAHERGLVTGEVGRGTYVLGEEPADNALTASGIAGTKPADVPSGKIRFDTTAAPDVGQHEVLARINADVHRDFPQDIASYSRYFPQHWLEAGQRWLSRADWRPDLDSIVVTNGAQAASIAIITAFTNPGDRILFENLTYAQISRSVRLLGRRTIQAGLDEYGLIPEEFERACRQQHPTLAFLMPTLHNPTLSVMPEERRRAIADIARRYNVWLIEDDIYGVMCDSQIPPLASFAPERTFVVSGLSKAVAAGIRSGWVACPAHCAQRVKVTHKMVTGGAAFLLAETGAQLVLSGEADAIHSKCREETVIREEMARRIFDGFDFVSKPSVPFLWMGLPEPWLSGTFKAAAYESGILIDDEDEFKAGRVDQIYHRVRVAFSSPSDRHVVENCFLTLRRLLENEQAGYEGSV